METSKESMDWTQYPYRRKYDCVSTPSPRSFKKVKTGPTGLLVDMSDKCENLISTTKDILNILQIPRGEAERYISRETMTIVKEQLRQLISRDIEVEPAAIRADMRMGAVDKLMGIINARITIVDQLGRAGIPEEMRQPYLDLLATRQQDLVTQEKEFLSLERLLSFHAAIIENVNYAHVELEDKIEVLEEDQIKGDSYTINEFPDISILASLLGKSENCIEPLYLNNLRRPGVAKPSVTSFKNLPSELRQEIWNKCLPGPRVITGDPRQNQKLKLLRACHDSRSAMERKFTPIFTLGERFPVEAANISYVNSETDTFIRDLTVCINSQASIFDFTGSEFFRRCSGLLSGLVNVKHLAIAFDLSDHDGFNVFPVLHAACPQLKTLTLFQSSQMDGVSDRVEEDNSLRFVDLDSNFYDYAWFEFSRLKNRRFKRFAHYSIKFLKHISTVGEQYKRVCGLYQDGYGLDWSPTLKVRILVQWSAIYEGYQARYLNFDHQVRDLYRGKDGEGFDKFFPSYNMCDADGELFSRYDGIRELFGDV